MSKRSSTGTDELRAEILRLQTSLLDREITPYLWWRSWMWQCLSVKASKFRNPTTSFPSRVVEIVLFTVIMVNASFAFLALADRAVYERSCVLYQHMWVQIPSLTIFVVEYGARLWSCVESTKFRHPFYGRLRWAGQPLALFDLLCIVLYCVPFGRTIKGRYDNYVRFWMGTRLLLLLRFERQLKAFRRMAQIFGAQVEEFLLSAYFTCVCILAFGVAFYWLERESNESVTTLWSALYWSIATITSVGYGDITPATVGGKFLAGSLAFVGFLVFTIPTGVIASAFMVLIAENRSKINEIHRQLSPIERDTTSSDADGGYESPTWQHISDDVAGVCDECRGDDVSESGDISSRVAICAHARAAAENHTDRRVRSPEETTFEIFDDIADLGEIFGHLDIRLRRAFRIETEAVAKERSAS